MGQLAGKVRRPGDIRTSSPNQNEEDASPSKVLFVKLLKSSNQQVRLPSWDLMMKKRVQPQTNQLNKDGFQFDIYYEDDFSDGSLKNLSPKDLISLCSTYLTWIRSTDLVIHNQMVYLIDVPGLTVREVGSIVFPVLEPFGSSLDSLVVAYQILKKYKYQQLYDSTCNGCQTYPWKNKFVMVGRVKSNSTGEIPLGPFVPRKWVKVTAGTITLIEGELWNRLLLGKLRILNPAYLALWGTPHQRKFWRPVYFFIAQQIDVWCQGRLRL